MTQPTRRIVTGHKDGKATIMIADVAPNVNEIPGWGIGVTELWVTNDWPISNDSWGDDQGARPLAHDPGPNGTIFRVVEFPPESAGKIDPEVAFKALGTRTRPSADDSALHPSMHKTDSIDYLVIIAGEMHMVMEEGEVLVKAGDCIVQRGTNHAWVNRTDKPCVLAVVLIDAKPAS